MKKTNLLTLVVALLLTAVFALAACGGPGDDNPDEPGVNPGGKTIVQFAGRGSADEEANYTRFLSQFMEENPDIIVNPNWYADESSYAQGLQNAGRNLPDVFMMDDRDFLAYVDANRLLDISSYVEQETLNTMFPSSYEKYYYNSDNFKLGKSEDAGLYGLPKDQGPYVLVYNKELFNRCAQVVGYTGGYPSATDPMTFTEFSELLATLCNETTRKTVRSDLYGIGAYEMQAAIYSNNANYFDDTATNSRITEKNFTDALQFIADLNLKYNVMPAAADQASSNGYQRFTGGSAIFCFAGPWDCTAFWRDLTFEWDIIPVCVGEAEGAVSTAWVGSMAYSVSANSKVKAAAVKLATYLATNEDSQRTQYQIGQAIPNLIEMATNEYINDTKGLLSGKNPASRSVFIDTVDGIRDASDKVTGKQRAQYYTYSSVWYADFEEYLNTQGLWSGAKTAAEICNAYNSTFQLALDEMKASLG
ncbi:MAG: extracellular solute-binding protein [Clostridia bacterium]|nr:extracellular solute-binding protein [Clostridia bacterium]